MIIEASKIGADYIKFQTFSAENLVTKFAKRPKYAQSKKDKFQFDLLRSLEIEDKQVLNLKKICKKNKIGFLSSAFDLKGLKFLKSLNLDYFKVPSGEINNLPYLRYLSKLNKKIILSTGMSNLKEISFAIKILKKGGIKNEDIFLLQCNTQYPSPLTDANLKVLKLFKKNLRLK